MKKWQRTTSKMAYILILTAFIQGAHAEYYLEHPEPGLARVSKTYHSPKRTHPHQHVKYSPRKKPVSHVKIQVYYLCPTCCSGFGRQYYSDEELNRCAITGNYVAFHAEPTSHSRTTTTKLYETYDMRTSDDDVMRDPHMNNQY